MLLEPLGRAELLAATVARKLRLRLLAGPGFRRGHDGRLEIIGGNF